MKKLLVLLALLFPLQSQARQFVVPVYTPSSGVAYNNGYRAGVRDQKNVTARALVATGVIVLGAIIIYKAFTGNDAPQGNFGTFTYRF